VKITTGFTQEFEDYQKKYPGATLAEFIEAKELRALAYERGARELYKKARLYDTRPKSEFTLTNPHSGEEFVVS